MVMLTVAWFVVGYPLVIKPPLMLVDISGDTFTPEEAITNIYDLLKERNYKVNKKTFETIYGHESWILDGKRFYEFIKSEFTG